MTDHFGSKRSLSHGTEGRVIHWAGTYEALFGWFLRRTHGTVDPVTASGEIHHHISEHAHDDLPSHSY